MRQRIVNLRVKAPSERIRVAGKTHGESHAKLINLGFILGSSLIIISCIYSVYCWFTSIKIDTDLQFIGLLLIVLTYSLKREDNSSLKHV